MSKKSLLISIAVLVAAIFFVLTGCEGPAGPAGQQGTPGQVGPSEIGDITVTIEEPGEVIVLPNGFTYPDGAKVVSGDATDIANSFNGGIFVADTSDASGAPVAGAGSGATGTGYVYAQDGVNQVIWAGPGVKTGNLGAISVPPGKTLFIAA
ncbi:MAG: hypothetical protein LBP42_05870, partial [Treponema sp.]|nr:hypothetical protein [Treponema sp.]